MVQRYGDFPNAAIPHIWDIWAIDLVFCNFFFGNSPDLGYIPEAEYKIPLPGSLAWGRNLYGYVACPHAPTQLVAPRAVTMAVATDAMICTINLMVSFFVMVH